MTESTEKDLQAQIDELKAEMRSLQADPVRPQESSRRHLLKNLGLAAAGAVAGTVAAGSPAEAATGDELILGQVNVADATTIVRGDAVPDTVAQFLEEESPIPPGLGVVQAMADGQHIRDWPDWCGPRRPHRPMIFPMAWSAMCGMEFPASASPATPPTGERSPVREQALVLTPSGSRDDTASHHVGEIHQTRDALSACVEDGTPGVWRKVAGNTTAGQLHVVAPQRIYDSRDGQQPLDVDKGVLENEAEPVIDASYGGAVPAAANGATPTAALVNLTITDTTSDGGFLALFENGTTWQGSSSINWDAVGTATANTTVSLALDADGTFKVRASPGGGTDFVIDVLGYWL